MYLWLLVITYYGVVVCLFNQTEASQGREALEKFPTLAQQVPCILFASYLFYTHFAGGIEWKVALPVFVWMLAPTLLLWPARNKGTRLTGWDIVAIFALWLPFDLHLIGKRHHAVKDALDWPMLAVSAVIIGLVCWVCQRQLDGTKTNLSLRPSKLKLRDLLLVLGGLCFLAATLLPLGLQFTSFLSPMDFLSTEPEKFGFWTTVLKHLGTLTFGKSFVKIFITIALSEEFLFRGIIQNFLDKNFRSKWGSLGLTSLLFGCAHLNNGATSIYPSGWNLTYMAFATVAGFAYGTVFRYSSSILFAMALHALVDSIWHTFFR